jgi:hypothetical protein
VLHRFCVVLGGAWAVAGLTYATVFRDDPAFESSGSLTLPLAIGILPLGLYFAIFWIFSSLSDRDSERSVESAHHPGGADGIVRIAAGVFLAIFVVGVVALYRLPDVHRYELMPLPRADKYGPVALLVDSNTGHICTVELNEHGQQPISTFCWPWGSGPPEP